MQEPIKVVIVKSNYVYKAFTLCNLENHISDSNKFEAIVGALEAIGAIEIIDLDEPRKPNLALAAIIKDDEIPI